MLEENEAPPAQEQTCEAAATVCMALTKTGHPCKNRPLAGSIYCSIHQLRPVAGPPARTDGAEIAEATAGISLR